MRSQSERRGVRERKEDGKEKEESTDQRSTERTENLEREGERDSDEQQKKGFKRKVLGDRVRHDLSKLTEES